MKKFLSVVLLLFIALTACRKMTPPTPGKVVGVADGDTITVLDEQQQERKVRLNGIDAPEKGQPFGDAAKQHLSDLVFGKVVRVEGQDTDRYGRLVGVVLLDELDVNLEQLKSGYAWYYREYEREVAPGRRPVYAAAESAARAARAGLWRDAAPEAPWEFRSEKRAAQQGGAATTEAKATPAANAKGKIIGNRNSHIFHRPDCPGYEKVSEANRVYFATEKAALEAGFRLAGNCPQR